MGVIWVGSIFIYSNCFVPFSPVIVIYVDHFEITNFDGSSLYKKLAHYGPFRLL